MPGMQGNLTDSPSPAPPGQDSRAGSLHSAIPCAGGFCDVPGTVPEKNSADTQHCGAAKCGTLATSGNINCCALVKVMSALQRPQALHSPGL